MLFSSILAVATAIAAEAKLPSCVTSQAGALKHPAIYHDCKSLHRIQDNYQQRKSAYFDSLDHVVSWLPALQPDSTWTMAGPFETVSWAGRDGHNIPL